MNILYLIMLAFAILGALDLVIGNRFKIGEEFEKGIMMFGTMFLSMVGMIVISPAIGSLIQPLLNLGAEYLNIDPSLLPSLLLANDMGGAHLSSEVARDSAVGAFNALVVSSMFGCTVSFTIPFSLGIVKKDQHSDMFFGFLCGVVTIPIGCFVSGIVCGINIFTLLLNLLPVILFSVITAVGLKFKPKLCIKIFKIVGIVIKGIIILGLILGIVRFVTGYEIVKNLETIEEGATICLNATVVFAGAFPFLNILSRILKRPMKKLGERLSVNESSAFALLSTLVTNAVTFREMEKMDKRGVVLNSSLAISGAFVFAGHFAFTMAFNSEYILPVIIGKLVSGFSALFLAIAVCRPQKS